MYICIQVGAEHLNENTTSTQKITMIMNSAAYQLSPFAKSINYIEWLQFPFLPLCTCNPSSGIYPLFYAFSSPSLPASSAIPPPLHAHHHPTLTYHVAPFLYCKSPIRLYRPPTVHGALASYFLGEPCSAMVAHALKEFRTL
jgi:hypothetical protein